MSGKTIKIETTHTSKPVDEILLNTPTLIDTYAKRLAKAKDELIYSLFEKCGYRREDVLGLIKDGIIDGNRCTSTIYPNIEWITFSAHGNVLFTICEKFDSVNHTVSLAYQMAEGDNDGQENG